MSWTRSNCKETRTFSYEVRNASGEIIAQGSGFADHREAEQEAMKAERELWTGSLDAFNGMSDDELLAALEA